MKAKNKKSEKTNHGFVMPLAVLIVVLLLITGLALIRLGFDSRILAARTINLVAARTAADAGIVRALREMNNRFDPDIVWDNTWLPYQSAVTDLDNTNSSYSFKITGNVGTHKITSTGYANTAEKKNVATAVLQTIFDYALMVKKRIVLKSGTTINGYNSSDPNDTIVDLKIGTKSIDPDMIVLNNGVTVNGDVLVGVGGNVETVIKDLGATTGPRYMLPENVDLDLITVPNLGASLGNITAASTTITASGKYNNIDIPNSGLMKIVGKVQMHVTGDLQLKQSAEIRVTPGSSLTLFLDGDLIAGQSNGINNETEIPGNFMIFGTGKTDQKWEIKNSGDFFGAIYAPNADVILKASGDIYGCILGNSFELKEGGNVYYDKALRNTGLYKDTGFVIDRWWEE